MPRYTRTPRMRSRKKSFLCHDPRRPDSRVPRQSLGTQQEQLSTASLFRSVLVVPCLRLVPLGASIQPRQPGPQSNNAGVFLGVCSRHVPAHSLTPWQTTRFSCLHRGIRQRRGLSSVHLTAWYLILCWAAFLLQTWLLSARLCYFLRCCKGKRHRAACMLGTRVKPGWVALLSSNSGKKSEAIPSSSVGGGQVGTEFYRHYFQIVWFDRWFSTKCQPPHLTLWTKIVFYSSLCLLFSFVRSCNDEWSCSANM